MEIEVLSLFPDLFAPFFSSSLIGKAAAASKIAARAVQIRDFASPPHYSVDDTPYGGGAGMVMRPEPLVAAIEASKSRLPKARTVLMSASGTRFDQAKARELAQCSQLIFVCGRYEGIDQRVIDLAVDDELCIGDYILMGGEVGAMVVLEAVIRLLPGVIGNTSSLAEESFSDARLLESPQYTRPPEFRGLKPPDVLLSGNHAAVARWRREQSVERTRTFRPDLVKSERND